MVEVFPRKSLIVSRIKEIEICLTPKLIREIFDIPLEGGIVFGDDWFIELDVQFENVCQLLYLPNTKDFFSSSPKPRKC